MDRSLDSIGSCSLDVDADSSEISDTSGSLNFPTPLSVKDITREFTANIRERCTLRSPQQPQHTTTAYVDPATGKVRMVLSPPAAAAAASVDVDVDVDAENEADAVDHSAVTAAEKKPSYLNLACCVNGYSNLTTYDSKIRQDINKSREVSPIRPSTSSLQYCKRHNSLAAPQLVIGGGMPLTKQPPSTGSLVEANNNNNCKSNGHAVENGKHGNGSSGATSSFIQQRVERLYGPGALAQGFYSPKKHGQGLSSARQQKLEVISPQTTELSRKFKQLSPSKDYGEFRKKLQDNCTRTEADKGREKAEQPEAGAVIKNGDVDLPVFRHLSHEFRAQLPTVSPKRNVPRGSPPPELEPAEPTPVDVVDHEPVKVAQLSSEEYVGTTKISGDLSSETTAAQSSAVGKDGNYFLRVLKEEQARLLALAAVVEKYTDALENNPDISEDTFGMLRSASGKARLLVSQKMKQFEGLCHNNLNRSPEDAFPTTVDDLQGFWDMVYLQVAQVDSIFASIEQLKSNDWKRMVELPKATTAQTPKSGKTVNSISKAKSTGTTNNANVNSSKTASANSAAALKREAQRKQLMEMKRQRRVAMAAAVNKNQTACDGATELQDSIGDSSTINNELNNRS
ncbi:vlc, isoform A [Drosophila willistoni]|uniref:Vlc, isoform A n=2 Tax=Drosophila willistoni TaxID=7260 RepID=Q8I1B1_DROWI|nr:uncharacterized protein LOC6637944 [Drosophila willistoni]XP_046866239.1 uncharacterized protein LOC6637944 [Drosophila willistoni]AAO01062.1 vlc-PA [Drosophila willistoni]EDW72104.1 vlc, isoform A [Drosophila willistoni]